MSPGSYRETPNSVELTKDPKPRPAIVWFSNYMEIKLLENDAFKGCWTQQETLRLLNRLEVELDELKLALKNEEGCSAIIRECADVANFAMMIADLHGRHIGRRSR